MPLRHSIPPAALAFFLAACGQPEALPTESRNEPPAATITSPQDGAEISFGTPIDLIGFADDPEDGKLTDSALAWTSGVDGDIGTGGQLVWADASIGVHNITLTAIDSDNRKGTTTASLSIRHFESTGWPEELQWLGDRLSWSFPEAVRARVEMARPGDPVESIFAYPARNTALDTAGEVPILAWPAESVDSLDLTLYFEDSTGEETEVFHGRVGTDGVVPPAQESLMRATMIDVGWGDAHLLETPSGRRILIDAGSDCSDNQASLRGFLDERITGPGALGHDIDHVFLTHLHWDHYKGLYDTVLLPYGNPGYDVGTVHFSTPFVSKTYQDTYDRLTSRVQQAGATRSTPRTSDLLDLAPDLEALVLNAGNPFAPNSWDGENENNSSFVLRLTYGSVSFVYTGDAEESLADRLRSRFADALDADVLKVGHHGSRDATDRFWVQAVAPTVALVPIDAGQVEFYLPHDDVISLLRGNGAQVFRSDSIVPDAADRRDVTGHVEVLTDGVSVTVRTHATDRAPVDCDW